MSLLSFLELNANFGKTSYYGFWFSLWFHCVLNVTICFYFLWSCLVLCSHQRINFKTHAASVFPYPFASKRDQRNAKTIYEQKLAVLSKVQLPCSHPVPWYYHLSLQAAIWNWNQRLRIIIFIIIIHEFLEITSIPCLSACFSTNFPLKIHCYFKKQGESWRHQPWSSGDTMLNVIWLLWWNRNKINAYL